MTGGTVSRRVVLARLEYVADMLSALRGLPLDDLEAFSADSRNIHTAESCLRRALEALLDTGRHILAKGFGVGVSEYREIAGELARLSILTEPEAEFLRLMAGYRNRLTHLYHQVTAPELYAICRDHLGDVDQVQHAFRTWLKANPERTTDT